MKSQLGRADWYAYSRTSSSSLRGVRPHCNSVSAGISQPLFGNQKVLGRPPCRSDPEKRGPTDGRPSPLLAPRAGVPHRPRWSSRLPPRPSGDLRRGGVLRTAVTHPIPLRPATTCLRLARLALARPPASHPRCRCAPPKSGMLREARGEAEPARLSRACAPRAVGSRAPCSTREGAAGVTVSGGGRRAGVAEARLPLRGGAAGCRAHLLASGGKTQGWPRRGRPATRGTRGRTEPRRRRLLPIWLSQDRWPRRHT